MLTKHAQSSGFELQHRNQPSMAVYSCLQHAVEVKALGDQKFKVILALIVGSKPAGATRTFVLTRQNKTRQTERGQGDASMS